jgi:uncharacterized protein YciI
VIDVHAGEVESHLKRKAAHLARLKIVIARGMLLISQPLSEEEKWIGATK